MRRKVVDDKEEIKEKGRDYSKFLKEEKPRVMCEDEIPHE